MFTTLIQAEELQDLIAADSHVVILDCRHDLCDLSAGLREFEQGHLPDALHADMERDLSGEHRAEGDGRHPWPDLDEFQATLKRWNIRTNTQVIAYDAGHGAFAARAWFLLRMLGHEAVAVLDGGFARWQSLAYPEDVGVPLPHAAPSNTDASEPRNWHRGAYNVARLCDADAVQKRLERGRLLIDARAMDRFHGVNETIDHPAGHVPGAVNRPFSQNLAEDGRFKDSGQLRDEFEQLLEGRATSEVIVMCGSGVTATHHLLAMQHAGLDGAGLFTGSWSGWIEDPSRPIATEDLE